MALGSRIRTPPSPPSQSSGSRWSISELDIDVLPPATRQQTADVAVQVEQDPKLNPYPNGLPESVEAGTCSAVCRLIRGLSEAPRCYQPGDVLGRHGRGFLAQRLAGPGAHQLSAALRPQRPVQNRPFRRSFKQQRAKNRFVGLSGPSEAGTPQGSFAECRPKCITWMVCEGALTASQADGWWRARLRRLRG